MQQENKPANEAAPIKYDWQPVWKWINTTGFKMLIGFAGIITVSVIILALFTNNLDTMANILTVGILTVLTIVVTTINAVATRQMVDIMDRQESEITKQRQAAEKQWQAMIDALERTDKLLAQNEQMIAASNRQANASEEGLKQARELFYTSERAYVDVEAVWFDPIPAEGVVSQLFINVINTGKTSARELSPTLVVLGEVAKDPMKELPPFTQVPDYIVPESLHSNEVTEIPGPRIKFRQNEIDAWKNGIARFSVVGDFQYRCIQDRTETLSFFFIYSAESSKFKRRRQWTPYTENSSEPDQEEKEE